MMLMGGPEAGLRGGATPPCAKPAGVPSPCQRGAGQGDSPPVAFGVEHSVDIQFSQPTQSGPVLAKDFRSGRDVCMKVIWEGLPVLVACPTVQRFAGRRTGRHSAGGVIAQR